MTDLCKNCGCCHLGVDPTPCQKMLEFCQTCKQWGHTTNFCPMGVRDANGQIGPLYWMLCSNCDRWHLPQPCEQPLQQCTQCLHYGHIAHYCPVDPLPLRSVRNRAQVAPPQVPRAGAKRKYEDEEEGGRLMVKLPLAVLDIKHVHPSLLGQVRRSIANEFAQLLLNHTRDEVLALIMHEVPLPSAGNRPDNVDHALSTNKEVRAGSDGALPKPLLQQPDPSPVTEPAALVLVTPATATKAKKKPKQDRGVKSCADCKARHQRCRHRTGNGERSTVTPALSESALQPPLDDQLALESRLQQNAADDVFTNQPMLSGSEQMAQMPSDVSMAIPAIDIMHGDAQQQQMWMLNTDVSDLDMLAQAAQQASAQFEQSLPDGHGQAQGAANHQLSNEQLNAMDFSQLLNSDAAAAPASGGVQGGHFNGELDVPPKAEQPRKRSTRKKKM